ANGPLRQSASNGSRSQPFGQANALRGPNQSGGQLVACQSWQCAWDQFKEQIFGRESRLVDETDARGRRLRELSRQVSSPRITYAPYGAGRLSDKRCPSTMVLRRSATGGIVHHTEVGGACQRKSAGARSERTCAYEKRSHARSPIGRGLASNACGLIELHRFF